MQGAVLQLPHPSWDEVSGIATALALVVALATYYLSARRERATRRAELVRGYTADFYSSDILPTLFMAIDYERFTFVANGQWLGKPDKEGSLVRLLDLFNSVGHNCARKVLLLKDIHGTTLGYAILRTYTSPEVQAYLKHVQHWDGENLGTGVPFQYFQELALALAKKSRAVRAKNKGAPAVISSTSAPNLSG